MANTTNLDLVKPAGTDHALISVLNSNSDKIDAFAGQTNDSLSAEQNGLAYIVGNTNTTGGTLAVGQFVYVKGHSTIAEGLRKVTSSISANGSITTSNTDACSEGGLNALNSKIADKTDPQDITCTGNASYINNSILTCRKVGNIAIINGFFNVYNEIPVNASFYTIGVKNKTGVNVFSVIKKTDASGVTNNIYFENNGNSLKANAIPIATGEYVMSAIVCVIE